MVQNAVRFDAKRKVKWCKTQGKMPLNAVQNAAKCETESINIHYDCINNPFQTMKHMAKKGKLATKKWVFRAKKRVIGVGKL